MTTTPTRTIIYWNKDNCVRQELQKQFSEKHQVDMKFLKVPKVEVTKG
jgi:hypothetical protein